MERHNLLGGPSATYLPADEEADAAQQETEFTNRLSGHLPAVWTGRAGSQVSFLPAELRFWQAWKIRSAIDTSAALRYERGS